MNNPIFGLGTSEISKTFGTPVTLVGPQLTAAKTVSEHFISIGKVMGEGSVLPNYAEFAQQKLLEAKNAVDYAIAHGWNGGKSY